MVKDLGANRVIQLQQEMIDILQRERDYSRDMALNGKKKTFDKKRSPKDVWCPACQARPGKRCTQPTDTGRNTVTWFHHAREDKVR